MNPFSPTPPCSATRLIRREHERMLEQFHQLEVQSADAERSTVVRGICAALEIHAQLEEEIFYPVLRECGISSSALEHAAPEHERMRRLIGEVRSLEGQRALQDDAFHELLNAQMHHVADEETQLLPAAERFLSQDRLLELGAQMAARRKELAKPRAAELGTAMPAKMKASLVTVGALIAGTMLVRGLRRGRLARSH